MVDNLIRQTSKKTWYKLSLYINLVLFFIVAILIYLVVSDAWNAGRATGSGEASYGLMFALVRDVAILAVVLALIFFQQIKNLWTIMKRTL
jgi:hypothetical protein